jgi:hypothetical protein
MRFVWTAVILASLLILPGLAIQAQTGATTGEPPVDNTVVLSDPDHDVIMSAGSRLGVPQQNASCAAPGNCQDNFDHIDILRVTFGDETTSDFRVTIQLKTLTSANTVGSYRRQVTFSYGALYWRLLFGGCGGQQQSATGCLQSGDGGFGGYRTVRAVQTEIKADQKSIVFIVPKGDIYNQDRVPPRYGAMLSNISAYASHSALQSGFGPGGDQLGGVSAFDLAPQIGFAAPFYFNKGSRSLGSLFLNSQDPIRVSNGEATTIVYRVLMQNKADRVQTVQLETRAVPEAWSVRVPALLTVQPFANLSFPVIASIPFTHDHGRTVTFNVNARAGNEAATIDLGVFWTDVPQPSAHHQGKQWFHSANADNQQLPAQAEFLIPQKRYWMNGIDKDPDPEATDANVPAQYQTLPGPGMGGNQGQAGQFTAVWFFPLSPPLLIGLDFDLSRTSPVVFDLISKVPATSATVTARLHYCDPQPAQADQGRGGGGGFGNAATCNQQKPTIAAGAYNGALSGSGAQHFDIQMTTQPQYDLIPYKHGANIGLSITLVANTPQNAFGTEPRPEFVTKGATLEMALFEYHDPVEQAFQAVGSLQLTPVGEMEKRTNPGKTSVFTFDLESGADVNQSSISLEIQGVNREWAKILGPTELELEPKQKRNITVAVSVPADAVDDERADLFLRAENLEDPSIVTAVRFRTTVTTAEQFPDEVGLATAPPSEGSPGAGFVVAVLAAACAILLVRRRA